MLGSLTIILFYVFCALLKVIFLLIAIAYFTLAERKVMGSIHRRRGPNTEGFWGVLQPLFDGAKLILKELIVPTSANKRIFIFAPFIILVNSLSSWSLIPFNLYEPLAYVSFDYFITTFVADFSFLPEMPLKLAELTEADCLYDFHFGAFFDLVSSWYYFDGSSGLTYGILALLTFSSLNVYSIIMAGWSSSSKYAFLGALRSASQMVSYEVVLSVVVLTAVTVGGTFDFSTMVWVQTQTVWFVFPLLPIFIIFLIAALAETNRAPFDLPEAEAELVAGYNVEYSAIVFALFFLAEYCNMLLMAIFCAIVFWGGWDIPFCNPADTAPFLASAMLTFKTMFFAIFFIVVRASFPRYRYDQLMDLGWKVLMPVTTGFFLLQVSFLWTWEFLPLSHEGLPPLWYQGNTVAFNPLEFRVDTFTSLDSTVLFFLASSIVFSAFLVPILAHPVHSLLALICTLFQLGVVMLSSSIQYFGFVFLLVYVGAISILFLFILMLFDLSVAFQHRYSFSTSKRIFSGIFLLGIIKIYFIFVDALESFHNFCGEDIIPLLGRRILHSIYFDDNDSFQVSLELYKSYGLSYFFIVMLLLSAMLGSIIIAMYASSGMFRRYGFYNRLQVPLFTNLSNVNLLAFSLSIFLSLDLTFKKVLLEIKSFSNPDDLLSNNLQRLNWYAWSIPALSTDICVYPLYTSQCSTELLLEQTISNKLA